MVRLSDRVAEGTQQSTARRLPDIGFDPLRGAIFIWVPGTNNLSNLKRSGMIPKTWNGSR